MVLPLRETNPPRYPDANVLIHGFDTPILRLPENLEHVQGRKEEFFLTLAPMNYVQAFFADDVATLTIRIERCARMERRERDRICLHAELFWDDDRSLQALELGEKLSHDPARIAARLQRTPHGCDWMIQRWEWLREAYQHHQGSLSDELMAEAFDLLGRPAKFRSVPLQNIATLIETEIAKLRARRAVVAPADKLDRAMAVADLSENSTPELRHIRRYEAQLHKRLRWNMYQLKLEPAQHKPHPDLYDLYKPEPEPAPEPAEQNEPNAEPIPAPRNRIEPRPVMVAELPKGRRARTPEEIREWKREERRAKRRRG